jgi:hypothetical protein
LLLESSVFRRVLAIPHQRDAVTESLRFAERPPPVQARYGKRDKACSIERKKNGAFPSHRRILSDSTPSPIADLPGRALLK